MSRAFRILPFVFFFGLLSGCIHYKSVIDKDFHKRINKVYIQINPDRDMMDYFSEMANDLKDRFAERHIECTISKMHTSRWASSAAVLADIDSSHADVVLIFGGEVTAEPHTSAPIYSQPIVTPHGTIPGHMVMDGSTGGQVEVNVAMFQPHIPGFIWKASASISTGGLGSGGPTAAARNLMDRMVQDGLFNGNNEEKH